MENLANNRCQARLKALLIDAGLNGLPQGEITHAMRNLATAGEIMPLLEQWWKEGKVQRFELSPDGGRPPTIWRATKKILETEGVA